MPSRIFLAVLLMFVALAIVACGLEEDRVDWGPPSGRGPASAPDGDGPQMRPTTSAIVVTGKDNMPTEPGIYNISDEMREVLPEYARDTAQLLVHESGGKAFIWDREAALRGVDPESGLPFCENLPEVPESERREPTAEDTTSEPRCRVMFSGIVLGPPSGVATSGTVGEGSGS